MSTSRGAVLARVAEPEPTARSGIYERRKGAWIGVLLIAAAAGWLASVGLQALSVGDGLWPAIARQRGVIVGPALLAAVAAIFVAERLWPAVRRPMWARAHLVDASYLALFAFVVAPALILVDTGFSVEAHRHAGFLVLGRLSVAPRVAAVAAILVGMDAMNWAAHVANHRSAAMWRLHALHHSQEDMSVLTTFRTHPLVHVTYLPAVVPALVLGASGAVPGAALIAYGCFIALAHANLRWTFGPLGRVFVSPAYHRLHHVQVPVHPSGAVNFGFVLVGWDRMARRAVFPDGAEPALTGIAGRPVPIEQAVAMSRVPAAVAAQLTQPFRARAATDGAS